MSKSSPFKYCFCIVVDIITDPITTFTPIGRNATFTCETDNADTELSWIINDSILGVLYDTHVNHDVILLEKRGIFFESNGVLFTLTVKASLQNNLTEVSCRELLFVTTFETVFSATATSIVLGIRIIINHVYLSVINN